MCGSAPMPATNSTIRWRWANESACRSMKPGIRLQSFPNSANYEKKNSGERESTTTLEYLFPSIGPKANGVVGVGVQLRRVGIAFALVKDFQHRLEDPAGNTAGSDLNLRNRGVNGLILAFLSAYLEQIQLGDTRLEEGQRP